ncbi:TPA: EAL domain-containing protein [Vibrio vulnificus]
METEDIVKGLQNGEFYPVYQPIINALDGTIHAYEVLARWQIHKSGENILPFDFFQIAEQSGISHRITLAVIKKALLEHSQRPVALNVNLSPNEFLEPSVFKELENLINQFNYPKELITIEITEGACSMSWSKLRARVLFYVDNKWRISLDDYGIENQTLQRLMELPVTQFKLDRSLVPDLSTNGGDPTTIKKLELIKSISAMSQACGLEFVVEGIECYQTAQYLTRVGVTLHQGYYYAKPMPISQLNISRFIGSATNKNTLFQCKASAG